MKRCESRAQGAHRTQYRVPPRALHGQPLKDNRAPAVAKALLYCDRGGTVQYPRYVHCLKNNVILSRVDHSLATPTEARYAAAMMHCRHMKMTEFSTYIRLQQPQNNDKTGIISNNSNHNRNHNLR